jgi:hypothetical protein
LLKADLGAKKLVMTFPRFFTNPLSMFPIQKQPGTFMSTNGPVALLGLSLVEVVVDDPLFEVVIN